MPMLELDELQINYEVGGDAGGPPVLLVAGLADPLDSWEGQVPSLVEAGFRTIRFDNRGIGGSDAPPGPYTTEQLAADTIALADELGLDEFHLVGNSLGGMIAQQIAIGHPARVRSLVLSCTASRCGVRTAWLFDTWRWTVQELGYEAFARAVLPWSFSDDFIRRHPSIMQESVQAMLDGGQTEAGFFGQLEAVRHHDASERLSVVQTPRLVIAGTEDIIFPAHDVEQLLAQLPDAELVKLHAGHVAQWEQPEAFNDALVEFLGRHTG